MLKRDNETMVCDFYELTMANGYFEQKMADQVAYFDMFFRRVPDGGGFAIAAGLAQVIEFIESLHFDDADIAFLREKGIFSEGFLAYLRTFRFTGDLYAVPEGTPIFPNEPIVTVRAPVIEAQLIETFLLLSINHQSLIATKANRIVRAAQGRAVFEFGARRAQGADGAVFGARAAYIGGCTGSSCTATDRLFGVPATGTMAHSWVQMYDSEYEAFEAYCSLYPQAATLLVDTYHVIESGVPNAIRAFREALLPRGFRPQGIRIDSGDLTYLSKKARRMLDDAGFADCKIVASNALDEYLIRDLLLQGAPIDLFGVGERMITARSEPVFGGVYKLCAMEGPQGAVIPKIKRSENVSKITNPHFKKVYRLYEEGKAIADLLCVHDEYPDFSRPLTIFDPDFVWKRKVLTDYQAKPLLVPVFHGGKRVYTTPTVNEIRTYCHKQVALQWDEVKRFENPHTYYVDLSQKLWDIKDHLLRALNTADKR